MEDKTLVNLKINLRIGAKITLCVVLTAIAFCIAYAAMSSSSSLPSAYDSLASNEQVAAEMPLPPPPFAENPPISAFKDKGAR